MRAFESTLAEKVSKAKKAAESLDSSVAIYAWLSYAGCVILAIAGMVTGGNWLLIGSAASGALVTWVIRSFANLQAAKLELAAAVAEVEAKGRSIQNSDNQ
jgi:hypothetical protein